MYINTFIPMRQATGGNVIRVPDPVWRAKPSVRIPLTFAGRQIRIMSYNARKYYDKVDNPATPLDDRIFPKNPKSIKAFAEVIMTEDPDVLALQEVENAKVLRELNHKYLKGRYPNIIIYPTTSDRRRVHVAFMAKKDIKVVHSQSHTDKQVNGKPVFYRDFLEATFETPSGYRFTLFNTHFKSMRGGEKETMPIRLQEARAAAQIINEKFKDPRVKLMVVGDLNAIHSQYGQPVLNAISGREDDDPTNDLTEVLERDGWIPWTHNGGSHGYSKLDYCYVSQGLLGDVKQAFVTGRFRKRPWKLASDHLPFVVVLEEPDTVSGALQPRFANAQPLKQPPPKRLQVYA